MLYLSPSDFYVNRSSELSVNTPGMVFVLFTSSQCPFCNDIQPVFMQLSKYIQGCTFALMNVEMQQQRIRHMSARTTSPINYVPFLVFYKDGRPVSQYVPDENKPQLNFIKMKEFLLQQGKQAHAVSLSSRPCANPTTKAKVQNNQSGTPIPEYSIGKPVCSKQRVCYLGYDKAYIKT